MKKIIVARGQIKKLSEQFHITERSIYNALNYVTNSEEAKHIRRASEECLGYFLIDTESKQSNNPE